MNFVFLMDPLENVKFEKDTSFIFMLGAYRRGHKIFYVPNDGIGLRDGKIHFHAVSVKPQNLKSKPFIVGKSVVLSEDDCDAVFIRTDPPFDANYLMNTWLLDLLPARVFIMNDPQGIRTVNEKIWAVQFSTLMPPTLISSHRDEMLKFLNKHKDIIAKPTDGHGGKGVFRLKIGDSNTNVILETLSAHFTQKIILQKYIPAAVRGDKRILLLNGEPLGAVLRVHAKGEHRNNFFAGGTEAKTTITSRDKQIIETLKPYLLERGLYFVGIDILGDYLTEVNVTSPTCLQEMNRLYKKQLENDVIKFVEEKVKSF